MWSTRVVKGRQVDVFEPADNRSRFAVVLLPDGDATSPLDLKIIAEQCEHYRSTCIAPQPGESWWSSRLSSVFDPDRSAESWLIAELLPIIREYVKVEFQTPALAGIGRGGQGALRLGFKHPEVFPIVAALDAAIDHYELHGEGTGLDEMYPSREHCRQDSAIHHIDPVKTPRHIWFAADTASRWYRGNDRLHEKMSALGVPHVFDGGTGANDRLQAMFRFITQAMIEESRHLL